MDDTFVTLHGLAVKKSGDAAEIARVIGMPEDAAASGLETAQAEGWVIGARGRYMLTPQGRARLDEGYPQEFAAERDNADLVAAYEKFEVVNTKLLDMFTRWQTMTTGGVQIPNDHSDREYDEKIIDELGDIHERADRVLERFEAAVPRLGIYRQRLADAYDKVLAGEQDFVSGVRVDSYHTVWFELHEDILRILGRTRVER